MKKKLILLCCAVALAIGAAVTEPALALSNCDTALNSCEKTCYTSTACEECWFRYEACTGAGGGSDCPVWMCPPYGFSAPKHPAKDGGRGTNAPPSRLIS